MESIQRMVNILAFMEAHPQGISVQELVAGCNIPYETLCQDLKTLSLSSDYRLPFYTDQDEAEDKDKDKDKDRDKNKDKDRDRDGGEGEGVESSDEAIFQPATKWFLARTERHFTPVYLTVSETLAVLDILVVISQCSHQKESLQRKIIAEVEFTEEKAYRFIKGNRLPEAIDPAMICLCDSAAKLRQVLAFKHHEHQVKVEPLGLVYYSRLRRWYLVARDQAIIKSYNLLNITQARITAETFTYPADFSLAQWFAPFWGMEYGEPLDVKVRFSNRAQTFAKVRKDVAHRQTTLTVSADGQYLTMEDQIIGKNEFTAWLLGFGSAVEVLEPPALRQAMAELVLQTLQNYQGKVKQVPTNLSL